MLFPGSLNQNELTSVYDNSIALLCFPIFPIAFVICYICFLNFIITLRTFVLYVLADNQGCVWWKWRAVILMDQRISLGCMADKLVYFFESSTYISLQNSLIVFIPWKIWFFLYAHSKDSFLRRYHYRNLVLLRGLFCKYRFMYIRSYASEGRRWTFRSFRIYMLKDSFAGLYM